MLQFLIPVYSDLAMIRIRGSSEIHATGLDAWRVATPNIFQPDDTFMLYSHLMILL
jgi:hypothetical protein